MNQLINFILSLTAFLLSITLTTYHYFVGNEVFGLFIITLLVGAMLYISKGEYYG